MDTAVSGVKRVRIAPEKTLRGAALSHTTACRREKNEEENTRYRASERDTKNRGNRSGRHAKRRGEQRETNKQIREEI